jgi:hypothetical protein
LSPGLLNHLLPGLLNCLSPGLLDRLSPGLLDRLSPGLLDRLSPGLLTVCAGLLSRSSISKSPVNLHLNYFFIPMFLLWRFYLFKSVL